MTMKLNTTDRWALGLGVVFFLATLFAVVYSHTLKVIEPTVVFEPEVKPVVYPFDTIVKIVNTNEGGVGLGAGVFVNGTGTILTNLHNIGSNAVDVRVYTRDGTEYRAKTLWVSTKEIDLALIQIDTEGTPQDYVDIECTDPDVGEVMTWIGHPLGRMWTLGFGTVAAIRTTEETQGHGRMIQLQGGFLPGNSGGGMFNSAGKLVGIPSGVTSFKLGVTTMSWAVPSSTICKLLVMK